MSLNDTTCLGCGRSFTGVRGLRTHQSGKFVSMDCKPRQTTVKTVCECVYDCRSCSQSGDWHVHAGEECVLHPEAAVS